METNENGGIAGGSIWDINKLMIGRRLNEEDLLKLVLMPRFKGVWQISNVVKQGDGDYEIEIVSIKNKVKESFVLDEARYWSLEALEMWGVDLNAGLVGKLLPVKENVAKGFMLLVRQKYIGMGQVYMELRDVNSEATCFVQVGMEEYYAMMKWSLADGEEARRVMMLKIKERREEEKMERKVGTVVSNEELRDMLLKVFNEVKGLREEVKGFSSTLGKNRMC
jgi:hypothetical protein